jgi:hypothetical protein
MSLELMVATIFVLAKLKAITDFNPSFAPYPPWMTQQSQWNPSLCRCNIVCWIHMEE